MGTELVTRGNLASGMKVADDGTVYLVADDRKCLKVATDGTVSTSSDSGATWYQVATDLIDDTGRVSIHKVRGMSTANIADLAVFTVAGVDGLTYSVGQRILLKDQTTGAENGVYVVGVVDGGTAALTRAADWAAAATIPTGTMIVVDAGTLGANTLQMVTNVGDVTVATTTPAFDSFYPTTNGGTIQKRTLTATHATITTAGPSQVIAIGSTLPANSRIVGVSIHTVTVFSGGTVGDFTVDIGTTGDADAIVDGADLFAAAVDGMAATMPPGIAVHKTFVAAGAQLNATFACGTDDVADATAGSCVIDVFFVQLP